MVSSILLPKNHLLAQLDSYRRLDSDFNPEPVERKKICIYSPFLVIYPGKRRSQVSVGVAIYYMSSKVAT